MSAIFITGTDTGIGKTMVTCAIAAALVRRGVSVGVYKPVETGCQSENGRLFGADARRLAAAAGGRQPERSLTGYLFAMPAAPLAAAAKIGTTIDPARLEADIRAIDRQHDVTLVEGAGGLMVPIAAGFTYLDLVRDLALPVVVVVGSKLGCVNHALLTLRVLAHAEVDRLGYILNCVSADSRGEPNVDSNRELISAFTDTPCLGAFPYVELEQRDNPSQLGALAIRAIDFALLEDRIEIK